MEQLAKQRHIFGVAVLGMTLMLVLVFILWLNMAVAQQQLLQPLQAI